MLLPAWIALLLLPLAKTDASYDERDFACELGDVRIPTTSVCDGVLDCTSGADAAGHGDLSDESDEICVPAPYLTSDLSLVAREVTNTSLVLSWSKATAKVSNYSLELAGYFVTGRSEPHSFQNTVPRRLHAYQVQWLKPWTQYTLIMRPFYTETGKPHNSYKIGRAASVTVMTLPTAPEVPSLVSVLSAQQRSVLLNIVGPSFWNSDAVAFRVRWEPTSQGRGLRGELDVPLDADWFPEENTINATLPLQGGWDYRVYVSAVGAGTSGTRLKGPELKIEVSVPLDSYEIAAYSVRSTSAVLSWRSTQPADVFKVTVRQDFYPGTNIKRFEFDGTEKLNSRHSILVTGLDPWTHYEATLEGCSADDCSESVSTTFVTQPHRIPRPTVTRVEATGTRSIKLAWRFPEQDSRIYEGFRVQLCTQEHEWGTCLVAHTKENNFTVQELTPGTKYFIRVSAQLRSTFGALELGPAATASVETWLDVPVLTISHKEKIGDDLDTTVLAWTCINSSVSHLQYRLKGDDDWTTCDESADCDVTVSRGRTAALTSGYMRLSHHKQRHLTVTIRGCNSHGCGRETTVDSDGSFHGFLATPVVTVTRQGGGASFKCDNLPHEYNRGVEILWKCGGAEKIHREQRIQRNDDYLGDRPHSCETQVQGFPEGAQGCEFSVANYERTDGITYYGPRAQVTLA